MGLTSGIAPPPKTPPDTARAIKRAMRDAELAPAGWAGQLASYAQILLAIGLWSAWTDNLGPLAASAGALGIGILFGTLTPVGAWFVNLSGTVAALAAVFVTVVALGFSDGRLFGDEPWLIVLVVGLVVLGLDWRFVPRLRARAVASGLLVVPLVGADERWAFVGACCWFVGVLLTLWLLERDVRTAALRPVPLAETTSERPTNALDLVRAAGIALAIALVALLLVGDMTCSPPQDSAGSLRFDKSQPFDGRSPSRDSATDPDRILRSLDPGGREYEYRIDEFGRPYVTGSDGTRSYVEEGPGGLELRDDGGSLQAEIGEDEITVYGSSGDHQTYQRGGGGLRVDGSRGETFTLDRDGEQWVLRDDSGRIVARNDPTIDPDHLYVRDPDGNVLIPDADGDGRIPLPDAGGDGGLAGGGDQSLVYERDGDGRVVVRDPDGGTRTYDRDDQGRDRVLVEEGGRTRTYVYDESADGLRITEYEEDGEVVDEYVYDPDGRAVDRGPGGSSAGGGARSSSGGAPSGRDGISEPSGADVPWKLVGLVALGLVALLGAVLWLRRERGATDRTPLTWAERVARRLDDEGKTRGRGRRRGETVLDHSAALAAGPLPDERVTRVGRLLSSALFGPREPSPDAQRWAEAVVDDVSRAHPPTPRRERRRRGGST